MILLLPRGAVAFARVTWPGGDHPQREKNDWACVRAFVGQRAEPARVVVGEPKRRPPDPSPLGGADAASRTAAQSCARCAALPSVKS
jgi:hypothetical protein